jgi:hypothetical protein
MPTVYPKSATALLDARVVRVTWFLLALFGIDAFASPWLPHVWGWKISHLTFAAFSCAAITHVFLSFRHACPNCGKHPTIQGFKSPHPNSLGQSKVAGWGGVVVNFLNRRRLVCIHCGVEYRVERNVASN